MCHSCRVESSKATLRCFPTTRSIGLYDYRAQIIAPGPEYNKHKCGRWCFQFYRDWRIKCLLNHLFAPFLIPNGMISRVNVKRSSQLGAAFRKTPESLLNPVSNADSDEDEESGYASSESDYFEAKSGYTPSESDYFASESGYTSSESENLSSDSNDYASESGDSSSDSDDSSSDSKDYASESGDSSSDSDDSSSDSKYYASESEDSPSDSGSICSTSTGSTLPSRQLPPPPPPPPPSPEPAPQQVPNSWCGSVDCPFTYCMFDS